MGGIPADYSKVDEAIAKAAALDKDKYKAFYEVEKAISDVKRDKNMMKSGRRKCDGQGN